MRPPIQPSELFKTATFAPTSFRNRFVFSAWLAKPRAALLALPVSEPLRKAFPMEAVANLPNNGSILNQGRLDEWTMDESNTL